MFTALGDQTRTLFLKGPEAHKLHHEFTVATGSTIKKGQPVKLNTSGDIVPLGAADERHLMIGHSIHNGKAGELVTIVMVAHMIIIAQADAELNAGPVKYKGMSAVAGDKDYSVYVAATTAVTTQGWALDKAEESGEMVRVALF